MLRTEPSSFGGSANYTGQVLDQLFSALVPWLAASNAYRVLAQREPGSER